MLTDAARQVDALLEARDFAEARRRLARADRSDLARGWPRLSPMRRLLAFKLMDAASALEFYRGLPYAERYFLFCGFSQACIAPVLEDAPPALRRVFVQLPARFYDLMLRDLAREPAKAN